MNAERAGVAISLSSGPVGRPGSSLAAVGAAIAAPRFRHAKKSSESADKFHRCNRTRAARPRGLVFHAPVRSLREVAEDTTITDAIAANAAGPAKASNETTSVEQHPLPEQIAADKYLKNMNAGAGTRVGIRIGKFTTPGASEV